MPLEENAKQGSAVIDPNALQLLDENNSLATQAAQDTVLDVDNASEAGEDWLALANVGEEDSKESIPSTEVQDSETPAIAEASIPDIKATSQKVTPSTEAAPTSVETPAADAEKGAQTASPPAEASTPVETPIVETPAKVVTPEAKAKIRQDTIEELATNMFGMTDDEAAQMITAPDKVLPQMQAKLFLNLYESLYTGLVKHMPTVMQEVKIQQDAQTAAESKFFEVNPKLDRQKHGAEAQRIAQVYVQANPKATADEVIKAVGAIVMYNNGISVDNVVDISKGNSNPNSPASATTQTGYRPVTPGSAAAAAITQADNEFTQLATEFEREDMS